MINYNMRYRGPYEYDKFILNIFQYSNAIYDFENDLSENSTFDTINSMRESVDSIYNQVTKERGLSDKIYKELIMLNGE